MAGGLVLLAIGFGAIVIGVTGSEGKVWTMVTNQPYPFTPAASTLPAPVSWYPSWLPHPGGTANGTPFAGN